MRCAGDRIRKFRVRKSIHFMRQNSLAGKANAARAITREENAFRLLLCVLLAIAFARLITLGAYPLFDNTEARYAYIGKLMYETGNWVTPMVKPGVPFWAKPPLSMWAVAASYSVFGVSEFSARLPFFAMFVAMAGLVYAMAANLVGRLDGLVAAVIFSSSGLSVYLAGGVMTDPALILGTTLIMTAFILRMRDGHALWGYVFFAGLAIALLAKGPVGAVLPGMAIGIWVLWHNKWLEIWRKLPWIFGTLLTLAAVLPWYILAEVRTPGFLNYFIIGEHFERFLNKDWHGDMYGAPRNHPLGTIWLFGLLAALPWSVIFVFIGFNVKLRRSAFSIDVRQNEWVRYLALWILVPVLFFSATHAVLITYVGMSIPALAVFAAYVFKRIGAMEKPWFIPTAAVVPALFLLATILYTENPSTYLVQTQANTLAAFRTQSDTGKGRLNYFQFAPHSAYFYGEGEFTEVRDLSALAGKLDAGEKYFAMHLQRYTQLPGDIRARFDVVAIQNSTYLLKSKSSGVR